MAVIVLPGIGGSGEAHWQTIWEASDPSMIRFQPTSWDKPDLEDWMNALDRALARTHRPPILVAHSLACLLVAHWAARPRQLPLRGAFLVAVPDPDGPSFPAVEAATFRTVPEKPLPFAALIVASENDPYATLDYARRRATQWKTGFVALGPIGHVNEDSALGAWPCGVMLLEAFRAGTKP